MGEGELIQVVFYPGGQYNMSIWANIRDLLGGDERLVGHPDVTETTPDDLDKLEPKGVILAGGPFSALDDMDDRARMGYSRELIKHCHGRYPLLGICLGHQAIAHALGGKVVRGKLGEYSLTRIEITGQGKGQPIFRRIPDNFNAWASHTDEVGEVPEGFDVMARSGSCEVEAMGHHRFETYGLQFHPEERTQYGGRIFESFLKHSCRVEADELNLLKYRELLI